MNPFDLLNTALLDLLYELRETDVRLIVGGGYGLYLKQQYLRTNQLRTLLSNYPQARSTNDIDLFLRSEIIANDPFSMRDALQRAGYVVVERREYWQFAKSFDRIPTLLGTLPEVKIDLLTPQPPQDYIAQKKVRIDNGRRVVRVKPGQEGVHLHAHLAVEAIGIENDLIQINLAGQRSTGEEYQGVVCLPQALTYLVMKLCAFYDREFEREDRQNAIKHAFDLYPVIAMMTEDEYMTVQHMRKEWAANDTFIRTAEIARKHFSNIEDIGMLRMREHPDFSVEFDLPEFLSVLADIFLRP